MKLLTKLHALLASVGRILQNPVLLVIRLYWGWQFVVTGWAHLKYLEKTTGYFASLNIPAPHLNAMLCGGTECLCGMLLLLGLFSRFAAVALICDMCVAYATAEKDALHAIFSNPDKFLGADPFLFLYAAVIIFAFGPGLIAVDSLVGRGKKA